MQFRNYVTFLQLGEQEAAFLLCDARTSRSLRRYEQCISRSMITTRQLSEGLIAWIKLNPIGIDILPVFAIVGAYLEHLCPDIINEQADQRDEAEAACQK
jgi:hypothetical protein